MLYRGLRTAAFAASKFPFARAQLSLRQLPIQFQQVRTYADKIVKVPTMAESITEGTLKQWSKQIGERVGQDEEIATIETDKVRATDRYCSLVDSYPAVGVESLNNLSSTDNRLMSLSTHQKRGSSRSFWSTKRIRSLSVKILSA